MRNSLPSIPQPRPSARRKVLLVDDDDISMDVLAAMLGCEGHEVIRASDGRAALDLIARSNGEAFPDVLLVDIQMPGISGLELAQQIRAREGLQPRLLAMSATGVGAQELHGFDGFLLKPLAIEDLRSALQTSPATSGKMLRPAGRAANRRSAKAPKREESIDRAVVSKLAKAMSPAALEELYRACIADSRQRLGALRQMAAAGRLTEIPRGAHQVKGAASMIGAARIARLAATLELGSCKEMDTLRLLDDLLGACDELERMLLAGNLSQEKNEKE